MLKREATERITAKKENILEISRKLLSKVQSVDAYDDPSQTGIKTHVTYLV